MNPEQGSTVEMRTDTAAEKAPFWRSREKVLIALSGCFFFIGLGFRLFLPEKVHGPLWQGHLGEADALFIIAALVGGFNFFPQGLRALRRLSLDMDFLMTAAICGAVIIGEYAEAAAIAFLFSLFLARPCPFYILDEVEASLDDINIRRFLSLVRRYRERTQFIIITHQRQTMEVADTLYGVTLESDGTSRILSRRLAAAKGA